MKNISSWNFVLVTFKNRFRSFISTFLPEFSLSSYSFSRRVEARPIEREDISLKRWNFFERWGTTGGEIWIDIRSTSEISMVEKCQIIGSKTGNWISNDCSIRTFNLYFTRESARSETKAGSHTGFRPISRSTLTCITPPIHDRDPISPSILSDNREEEWNSRHAPSFPKIKFPFPFYLLEINATAEVANFNFQTSFSACLVIEKSTTRWYSIAVKNRRCCTRFNLIPSSSLSNDKNQRIGPIIRSFDACPRERVYLRSRKVFTLAKKKERGEKKKGKIISVSRRKTSGWGYKRMTMHHFYYSYPIVIYVRWKDLKIRETATLRRRDVSRFFIHARFRYLRFTRPRYYFFIRK